MLSIRSRLTLWYSVVLACGLIALGSAMWGGLSRHLREETDRKLSQRMEGLRTVLEVEGIGGGDAKQIKEELAEYAMEIPEGSLLRVVDQDGVVLLHSNFDNFENEMPAQVAYPRFYTVGAAEPKFRVLAAQFDYQGRKFNVLAASSLADVGSTLRSLQRLLLFSLPAVLMIAGVGGYWLSRKALAPVDAITEAARTISVQNLSRRLPVPATGDEIERLARTCNQLLERLEASIGQIQKFTADASHELRTPIALIRTTAELTLQRDRSTEQYVESLRAVRKEAERMTELTESMLLLARSDAGTLEMPLSSLNAAELIEEVLEKYSVAAERLEVLLSARFDGPLPVLANRTALHQILSILVENALRYTPRLGRIVIAAAEAEGGVELAVEDTGEGISTEALAHVFERFYQADASRTGALGVGLGLSIAQTIAQAHGSKIIVTSTPGAGARFSLLLKRGIAASVSKPVPLPHPTRSRTANSAEGW